MCKVFSYHAKAEFYLADDIAIFVSIVKSCYYPRMGCSRISLAGFPREAPTIRPLRIRPLAVFLRPATGRLRTAFIL